MRTKKMLGAMAMATLASTILLGLSTLGRSTSGSAYAGGNDCDPNDKSCNDFATCNCSAYYQDCLDNTATNMADKYTFGCRGLSHDACVQIVKQRGLCSESQRVCSQSCK